MAPKNIAGARGSLSLIPPFRVTLIIEVIMFNQVKNALAPTLANGYISVNIHDNSNLEIRIVGSSCHQLQ